MSHLERLLLKCQRYINAGLPIPLDLAAQAMEAGIILSEMEQD